MKNLWGFGPWKSSTKDQKLKGKPRFAGYVLVEKLGKGGFGEVFYAIKHDNHETGEYVALKKLQETQDQQEIKRFEREISILFSLRHPNVVNVLEYGEQDGVCFYTMELLQGGTLEKRMDQGLLSLEMVNDIVTQVASGLQVVHNQGIVHRDIKPDNIFLCQDGVAKVIDFGLAKDPKAAIKITLQSTGGNPLYMPPEVQPAIGGPPEFNLTPAYDQFALATVAFEALTGARPFISTEATPVLSSIFYTDLRTLAGFDIPGAERLDPVLRKALSKVPEDRFDSITDFAEALKEAAS